MSGGDGEVANEERKFDRFNETRFNFFVQSLSLRDYFVIYSFFLGSLIIASTRFLLFSMLILIEKKSILLRLLRYDLFKIRVCS